MQRGLVGRLQHGLGVGADGILVGSEVLAAAGARAHEGDEVVEDDHLDLELDAVDDGLVGGLDVEEAGVLGRHEGDVEGDDEPISETKTMVKPVSMTSCLYEKLTKLWNEKNQVILTVLNGKNEITRRLVADMSTIRKGMSTRALFPTTAATAATLSTDKLLKTHEQSVTFLYPLSAFSEDQRSAAFPNGGASDQVFLEVSCQINGAANPVL